MQTLEIERIELFLPPALTSVRHVNGLAKQSSLLYYNSSQMAPKIHMSTLSSPLCTAFGSRRIFKKCTYWILFRVWDIKGDLGTLALPFAFYNVSVSSLSLSLPQSHRSNGSYLIMAWNLHNSIK